MDWSDRIFAAVGALATAMVLGLAGLGVYVQTVVTEHPSCTVEAKDRAAGSSGSDMRLYTDCGIFTMEDDLWTMQWDSADRYHEIEEGATYDFTTRGIRWGFLSLFPRVIAQEEL